jgi:catechol 2,3-dioxygenase-like lactoylglutathione lyase family enzyme
VPTREPVAVRKFHASLNVSDLDRSVAFYSTLLGRPPLKLHSGYAKFELDEPPLVLSLLPGADGTPGALNHFGLRVSSSEELVEIQRRLEQAGFATQREDNVECCYARQTKFWIADPDRTLWEVYLFHADIENPGGASIPNLAAEIAPAASIACSAARWQYRIPEPLLASIPAANNSLEEVLFEGAFNVMCKDGALTCLTQEAYRVLKPGGRLRMHGLAGDRPLESALPPLPGPASVVERVPAAVEPMQIMLQAGFSGVRFEKLSQVAYFTVAGVPMREVSLVGTKPGYRPKKLTHRAVYLGPLSQVTDDFGNIFRRGELVPPNIHDWQALAESVVAGQFQFFLPSSQLPPSQA